MILQSQEVSVLSLLLSSQHGGPDNATVEAMSFGHVLAQLRSLAMALSHAGVSGMPEVRQSALPWPQPCSCRHAAGLPAGEAVEAASIAGAEPTPEEQRALEHVLRVLQDILAPLTTPGNQVAVMPVPLSSQTIAPPAVTAEPAGTTSALQVGGSPSLAPRPGGWSQLTPLRPTTDTRLQSAAQGPSGMTPAQGSLPAGTGHERATPGLVETRLPGEPLVEHAYSTAGRAIPDVPLPRFVAPARDASLTPAPGADPLARTAWTPESPPQPLSEALYRVGEPSRQRLPGGHELASVLGPAGAVAVPVPRRVGSAKDEPQGLAPRVPEGQATLAETVEYTTTKSAPSSKQGAASILAAIPAPGSPHGGQAAPPGFPEAAMPKDILALPAFPPPFTPGADDLGGLHAPAMPGAVAPAQAWRGLVPGEAMREPRGRHAGIPAIPSTASLGNRITASEESLGASTVAPGVSAGAEEPVVPQPTARLSGSAGTASLPLPAWETEPTSEEQRPTSGGGEPAQPGQRAEITGQGAHRPADPHGQLPDSRETNPGTEAVPAQRAQRTAPDVVEVGHITPAAPLERPADTAVVAAPTAGRTLVPGGDQTDPPQQRGVPLQALSEATPRVLPGARDALARGRGTTTETAVEPAGRTLVPGGDQTDPPQQRGVPLQALSEATPRVLPGARDALARGRGTTTETAVEPARPFSLAPQAAIPTQPVRNIPARSPAPAAPVAAASAVSGDGQTSAPDENFAETVVLEPAPEAPLASHIPAQPARNTRSDRGMTLPDTPPAGPETPPDMAVTAAPEAAPEGVVSATRPVSAPHGSALAVGPGVSTPVSNVRDEQALPRAEGTQPLPAARAQPQERRTSFLTSESDEEASEHGTHEEKRAVTTHAEPASPAGRESLAVETARSDAGTRLVPASEGRSPAPPTERASQEPSRTAVPLPDTPARHAGVVRPQGTVLLQLHPPDLGTLQVQIHLADRHLTAAFWAESPEVRAVLQAHLPTLQQSLHEHGFATYQVSTMLTSGNFLGQSEQFTRQYATPQFAAPALPQDDTPGRRSSGSAEPVSYRHAPHNGRVDVII